MVTISHTPRRFCFLALLSGLFGISCSSNGAVATKDGDDAGPSAGARTGASGGGSDGSGTGGAGGKSNPEGNGGRNQTSASGGSVSTAGAGGGKATPGGSGGAAPMSNGGTAGAGGGSDVPPEKMPGTLSKCPAGYQAGITAGQHTNFASAGQSRSFYLLLPPAKFTGPRPLLFAFHGTGLSGASVVSGYGLQEWADAGFIIVAPDSNGNGALWPVWDSFIPLTPTSPAPINPDLTLFDDLLGCVAANHDVDSKRIYVTGQSAGGGMTEYVLGRRSNILAGGVPESGTFDLTQPNPPEPVDPMMVIVTWGGDNDKWTGSAGTSAIANSSFAEQASLASKYWESRPGGHQVYCKGKEIGHVWIPGLNSWLISALLAHPKGAANAPGWTMPPAPASAPVTCSEGAATYTSPVTVNCATSTVNGCQAYCQLLGDCTVENGTLGPVASKQLSALGFAAGADVCSGCVAGCEADAKDSAPDTAVLSCIANAAPTTMCGPGFQGAAVFPAIGSCCDGSAGSKVCGRYCKAFKTGDLLSSVITGCP